MLSGGLALFSTLKPEETSDLLLSRWTACMNHTPRDDEDTVEYCRGFNSVLQKKDAIKEGFQIGAAAGNS